jgi:hypothetical protein
MARKRSIKSATNDGTLLDQLESVARSLASQIELVEKNLPEEAPKLLPQLAKQYMTAVEKIEAIKGQESQDDEIAEILSARKADGKPDTVR